MMEYCIEDGSGKVVYWMAEELVPSRGTIFFLHGLTADHTMFEEQIRVFKRFYNILTWDAPAHGRSRPYKDFTYGKAAECLKKILDRHEIEKVILAGQSMGGFISQALISRYPERVRAFIAIDSTPYGDYYSRSDKWWLRQVEWMAGLFPDRLLRSAMAKQTAVTREGRENMLQMLSVYSKKELCRLMGIGFAGFLEDNRKLDITCPVLLILGEKDRTGKVMTYNREWTKRTGYPLKVIRGAGHNANVDNPGAVNRCILDFLTKLG
jgi:pimeloyl-ACP methyl ester carboxylesterase